MTVQTFAINTLRYDAEKCIGCGMCAIVCPHAVFVIEDRLARPARAELCIECGACEINCPAEAIQVDSGPGCFVALINAALYGGEPTCGPSDDDDCSCGETNASCCGSDNKTTCC